MKYENGYYIVEHSYTYYSERFNKYLTVEEGFRANGASGCAIDIHSTSWVTHDKACSVWKWDDGTPITNFQA